MATKSEDRHIQKALQNENLFPLMARDVASPRVVIEWIKESIFTQPADKLHEALDCAIAMATEQEEIRKAVEIKKQQAKIFIKDEEC